MAKGFQEEGGDDEERREGEAGELNCKGVDSSE